VDRLQNQEESKEIIDDTLHGSKPENVGFLKRNWNKYVLFEEKIYDRIFNGKVSNSFLTPIKWIVRLILLVTLISIPIITIYVAYFIFVFIYKILMWGALILSLSIAVLFILKILLGLSPGKPGSAAWYTWMARMAKQREREEEERRAREHADFMERQRQSKKDYLLW